MDTQQPRETFKDEIALLEAKLAAKKKELAEASSSSAPAPEKHVFKEVIREHAFAREATSTSQPVSGAVTPSTITRTGSTAARAATAEEEQLINTYVAEAFTHGIATAVRKARTHGNPFLIDALHDRLVDEYYQKLVASRKVMRQ